VGSITAGHESGAVIKGLYGGYGGGTMMGAGSVGRLCEEGCTGWSMNGVMIEHVMGHDGGHVSGS